MRKLTALIFAAILALQGVLAAPAFAGEHESDESTTVASETQSDDPSDENADDTPQDEDPFSSISGELQFVDVQTGVIMVDNEIYLIDDPETLDGLSEGDFVQFDAEVDADGNFTASAVVAVEPASDEESADGPSDGLDDEGADDGVEDPDDDGHGGEDDESDDDDGDSTKGHRGGGGRGRSRAGTVSHRQRRLRPEALPRGRGSVSELSAKTPQPC